jgi:molybdopterin adenylyltransferase
LNEYLLKKLNIILDIYFCDYVIIINKNIFGGIFMKAGIITVSDKGSQGLRTDTSGPLIKEMLTSIDCDVVEYIIIPDERDMISKEIIRMSDMDLDLIFTTGGTGFSKRDVTPEATLDVVERLVPGIPEAMRHCSMQITPKAMLSRAAAGIRKNSLIVNLPGSSKAVKENLEVILPVIGHGIGILRGSESECGQSNK